MNKIDTKTNIVGIWNGTIEDLVRPFLTGGGDLIRARKIAPMYIKYCTKFRISADIAFAQMCHETGKLTFTGIAKADWNNFAGIGITGQGAVQKFTSEDLGVIAHIAHLAWYCYPGHVHSLCSRQFDPRHFEAAGKHHPKYTGDTTIGFLGGKWAVPGNTYAARIADYANIINNVSTIADELEIVKPLLKKGDKGEEVKKLQTYLNSVGYSLVVDGDFGPITEGAVKAFQKSKDLEEAGFIDEETKKAMNDFVVVEPEPPINDYQVIIQRGHVGRTKGATGTYREIEFTTKLGEAMGKLLAKTGLKYKIMDADNWLPNEPNKATIFLSLHGDGSTNKKAVGYSLGFKPGTNEEFKEQLAINYGKLSKFPRRKDNYTINMSKYYAWRDDLKRKPHVIGSNLVLIENGFLTNNEEREWMFGNINRIAECHVKTIVDYLKDHGKN